MNTTNPLLYVKAKLRADGPKKWPRIAKLVGRGVPLLKKIAYGDRTNPKLDTILPLVQFYQRRDARDARRGRA